MLFIASISGWGGRWGLDLRKPEPKEAEELQQDCELFLFRWGVRRKTPNLHFCLIPLQGKLTLLSAANCF